MVRKLTLFIIALVLSPVLVLALQDSTPPTTLDITGVNPNDLPTVEVAVNVLDSFGQPVPGLTPADFNVTGDIADITQIIQVENITDDDLPVSVVLTVDTSESMAGQPLDRAREAATVFVQQLRPQDSVAVVAFGSSARLVQDYTTDKAATLDALNNLQASGRTALYDGGVLSVQQAAAAPHSRRIVIFLSDGAEFEAGRSNASREDALSLAQTEGVPVYTIGLGFGTDRTYLQGLAENTNARFFESPTADDLTTIYTNIFDLIRTQYIVTLNVDAPADGTVYNFGLVAPTLDGSPQDTAELFTPVPVPIVRLSDVPAGEITSPVTLQADVLADDPLTQVRIQYDDREPININTDDLTRFEIPIGPNAFTPGDHTLQVQATDSDGDTGEAEITFQVGALPPTLSLDTRIDDGNLTVFMNTGDSQTPVTEAFVTIDGDDRRDMLPEEFGMFNALFPLIDFSAGEHTISVTATSENGESTTETLTLDFPQVPPQITLSLEPGTSLAGDIEVTYDISAQTDETTVSYQLNDNGYLPAEDSILINAAALGAGVHQLAVTVTDGNGQLTENVVSFTVSEDAIPTNTPTPAPSDTPTPTDRKSVV
jgi:Ca-activated chloride channel homolog